MSGGGRIRTGHQWQAEKNLDLTGSLMGVYTRTGPRKSTKTESFEYHQTMCKNKFFY
jgi:hypothetical protein